MSWKDKAHEIIAKECVASYTKAQKSKKKHVQYTVPEVAENLIECLDTEDEERAKSIFIAYNDKEYGWNYES